MDNIFVYLEIYLKIETLSILVLSRVIEITSAIYFRLFGNLVEDLATFSIRVKILAKVNAFDENHIQQKVTSTIYA